MLSKANIRALLTVLVTMSLLWTFSIKSYAGPGPGRGDDKSSTTPADTSQGPTGIISGSGQISVNGNTIQAGATLLSGSTISTGSDGDAIVDLGVLGRIEIKPNSTVSLTFAPGMVSFKVICDHPNIQVLRGTASITIPKTETLTAGKEETYKGTTEGTTAGGTDIIIDCNKRKFSALCVTCAGPTGLLIMAGLASIIVIGVTHEKGEPEPSFSPVRP